METNSTLNHELETMPVIDRSVISRLESFDPDETNGLVPRLIALYLDAAPEALTDLHRFQSVDAKDELRMLAHKFKTSNANLGLMRMYQLLNSLEDNFNDPELRKEIIERIETEGALALEAIKSLQRPTNPSGVSHPAQKF